MFFAKGEIIMNNIYKVIWSKAKNCYVVASEIARSHTKSASGSEKIGGVARHALLALGAACAIACGGFVNVGAAETVEAQITGGSTATVYTQEGTESYVQTNTYTKSQTYTQGQVKKLINDLQTGDVATNKDNITTLEGKTVGLSTDGKSLNGMNSVETGALTVTGKISNGVDVTTTLTAIDASMKQTDTNKTDITTLKTKTTQISYADGDGTNISGVTIKDGNIIGNGHSAITRLTKVETDSIKTDSINGKNLEGNMVATDKEVEVAVKAETDAREAADIALDQKINKEIQDRDAADAALEGKITKNSEDITKLDGSGVKYDNATVKDQITLGGAGGTKITNLKDADLSDSSSDAVTGKQLNKTNKDLKTEAQTRQDMDTLLSNRADALEKNTGGITRNDAKDETYIEKNVTVDNKGNVTAKGKLKGEVVDAGAVNAGSLIVENASTLKGDVTMNQKLSVTGDTSLNNTDVGGKLNVTGESSLKNTTVGGTLTAEKDATFEKNVTVENDLTVNGKLNVDKISMKNDELKNGKKHDSATTITADEISNLAKVTEQGNTTESQFTHNEKGTFNYAKDEKSTGEWKRATSNVTADGVSNEMTDSDKNTHTYYQTATESKEQLVNGDKSKSNFEKKTAEGNTISITEKDAAGNPKSSLTNTQTVNGEKTSVTNKDGSSTINQEADKISNNVTSADGTKSSTEVKADGITNTSKDGTITNDAKDIVNNATGDMTNTVGGKLTTTVTGQATEDFNGGLDTNVKGTENHTVTGDQNIHVTGKQTNKIDGNQENTIGGNQTTTVEGKVTENYKSGQETNVTGDKKTTVTGKTTEEYKGGLETTVTGDEKHTVTGNQTTNVTGNISNTAKNITNAATETLTDTAGDSTVVTENGKGTTFTKTGSAAYSTAAGAPTDTNIAGNHITTGRVDANELKVSDKDDHGNTADLSVKAGEGVKASAGNGTTTGSLDVTADEVGSSVKDADGKGSTFKQRIDAIMGNVKTDAGESDVTQKGDEITSKVGIGEATNSRVTQKKGSLEAAVTDGTNTNVSYDTANASAKLLTDGTKVNKLQDNLNSSEKTITNGTYTTSKVQTALDITHTAKDGTITHDAKDIVNNASNSITDKVGDHTRVLDSDGITDTVGGSTFKQRIDKIMMESKDVSIKAEETLTNEAKVITNKASEVINNEAVNINNTATGIITSKASEIKNQADKLISNKVGENTWENMENGKITTSIKDGAKQNLTQSDAAGTTQSTVDGGKSTVTIQNADGLADAVTDGTNTSVQNQTASAIAAAVKDGAGNENASVANATTSVNTIKSGSKANTVISTADGTSFINSEAAAPVGDGTEVKTTIKGNTITTGKVTMDYAEVMKDLGVTGKTTTGSLEVKGESKLTGKVTMESDATVGGTLDVTKKATFRDDVDIKKNLSVVGDVTASSYKVGDKTYISAAGINANDQKITNVADGSISEGSKDAVNGGQLYGVKRDLEHQVDKVGANAAAMANLRPMEFDPSSKWNIAAAIGNYGSETAAALGAFYRPNDDVMVNLSTAFGTGENMVGGGVSVRLGKSSNKLSREENNALKAQVDDLTARMDALLSVLNPNMSKDFPDVPENHWAYEAVSRLAGNDIVQGYPDGEFHGERTMTRYEMAEIIYNALSRGAEAEKELVEEFKPELQAMAASEKATAEKAEG